MLNCFTDYEFTENLKKGRKEIRLQISRYQSELYTDGWGRPLENPLNETKYLVKKSKNKLTRFNPRITVLFEDKEQSYYVNIVDGVNKNTDEKGFLLLNEFRNKDTNDKSEILKDRLYKTPLEAFHYAHNRMESIVNNDFEEYLKNKKKEIRKRQRIPRKRVRDFINSCNENDLDGILKNLDKNFIFKKNVKWKTESEFNGIEEFKKYIESKDQNLCCIGFKIRSSWNINLPFSITIGVKYFPDSTNKDNITLKYRQYIFEFKDDKIIRITEEK
ncbi:hypothetical protein ESY86_05390 [Subsaximicrobium wynnwilliamsii]|uniref:Uncharacterized protein n=1 Tax=Subsaximicrobium wynnwilliamsii TaxID=291179 RepID=A0A5C6ZLM5_9FLAO|nr:hypothetical protein ESY87_05165 [Subsaximicrobium wynnwilliamsii]TXD90317.1 hypothetical protein ESY86_05390 [Subsaximicrobium wynnwilliamsii]TXE04368.1 hypothetical protein ESY88_05160 [Subsaximicrobium wynnwilliamsii]